MMIYLKLVKELINELVYINIDKDDDEEEYRDMLEGYSLTLIKENVFHLILSFLSEVDEERIKVDD